MRSWFAVCVFALAATVYAADVQLGTWKINLAKSKYDPPNLAPKSTLVKNEAVDGGIKATVDTVDYTGKMIHYEYTAKYDAKDYPVNGDPTRDITMIKKSDDYTFEQTNEKGGKVTTTNKFVYARDGKSRTMTTTGITPQGQVVNNVVVWDRQ